MSTIGDIRTRIKAILDGVSGVTAKTYNRERYAAHWDTYLSLFKTSSNIIDGWVMQMESADEEEGTSRTNYRKYNFVLRHIYGFDDSASSQITFEDFNETVCDALRADPDLNSTADICDPPIIRISEMRMFGSVLCHYSELAIGCSKEIQY